MARPITSQRTVSPLQPLFFVLMSLFISCASEDSSTGTPDVDVVPTATEEAPSPPAAAPYLCDKPLQEVIDSASSGAVLDLSDCAYTVRQTTTITKPLTLIGGKLITETSDRWAQS